MLQNFEESQVFQASPEKILSLINNFEAYAEFLPGCLESIRISEASGGSVRGKLVFGFLNKTYSFESTNSTDGFKVKIDQHQGPFSNFSAFWLLESLDADHTNVNFKASFDLPFLLKIFARQGLIDRMGIKFMNAFAERLIK